ncbi:flavin reductase family protein [Solimonas terrae]|uniref:Flavin reductase n=1 Tax=Solimonas terrae TaxID=1396819 RepID=A0A6M2BTI9_9GAMM|nr:flavin reductase family protein [Solimonas terrae]NGY05694.1 flavin reductase [Solimonas terrae]
MGTASGFDARAFRSALGSFTTGVTIVTTRDRDGAPVGITANSFNSVSLDPPMVLWSLARSARSLASFANATHWAVHILSAQQEALSNRFAKSGSDKFAGLAVEAGHGGAPLLAGCAARLQCRSAFQYEGGDHLILVGEVLDFDSCELPPLVFQSGRYAFAARRAGQLSAAADASPAIWREDHLGYLLGRAWFQFYGRIRARLDAHGLSDADYFALTTLVLQDGASLEGLNEVFAYSGVAASRERLQDLAVRGLLETRGAHDAPRFHMTEAGRRLTLELIAAADAIEADALQACGSLEAEALRHSLRHLIRSTDPGLPDLWTPDSQRAAP